MGVQQHDDPIVFWDCFGKRMARHFPAAAECASEIASQVAAHGIVTVGGMADLSLEALEECITVGGGSAKWAKAVYSLVQACNYHPNYHPMRYASTEPPPSAALVVSMKKQPCAPRFEGGQLGATLIKDGTLGALILPRDRLLAAVTETKDPQLNVLSWSDTVAVMDVVHVWIIAKYGNAACCGSLFDHLANQLDASKGGLFAKPFGKLTWKEKLYNKFKTKRRPENSEIKMDASLAASICDGTKQLIAQGLTLKIMQPRVTPPEQQDENACANGRQAPLWFENRLDEITEMDVEDEVEATLAEDAALAAAAVEDDDAVDDAVAVVAAGAAAVATVDAAKGNQHPVCKPAVVPGTCTCTRAHPVACGRCPFHVC
jgi:hypothetical protein